MENIGNSNRIAREYLDSLRIETRYMNADFPDTTFELFGEKFSSPIMTAALSHLDHFIEPGAAMALAKGAADAGCVLWYGMAEEEEIDRRASTGAKVIEIIKPYDDRDIIYRKIEHAEKAGLLAVGIDIDHAFSYDGGPDIVNGIKQRPMNTAEMKDIIASTSLPFIVKGVLSTYDAEESLRAGAKGLVISHHNNRIEYAVPPLKILPDILKCTEGKALLFVDCMIQTGMDAFKCIALGAKGVCIGRPLMAAYSADHENGVRDYLMKARNELAKAMAFTGCAALDRIEASVIHGA